MTEKYQPNGDNSQSKFNIEILWMKRVQGMIVRGEYVDGEWLANALRHSDGQPIPKDVLNYLCRFLEGKIEAPKGRKPIPAAHKAQMTMVMRYHYKRNLQWLRARKKLYGHLDGWTCIKNADYWLGPPNEIAARMVAKRFFYGAEAWRSILNQISSQKSTPHCYE